jgi:signal transduction histidine kinase
MSPGLGARRVTRRDRLDRVRPAWWDRPEMKTSPEKPGVGGEPDAGVAGRAAGTRTVRAIGALADRQATRRGSLARLGWALVLIVAVATLRTRPEPSLTGTGLGVAVALAGYVVVYVTAVRAAVSGRLADSVILTTSLVVLLGGCTVALLALQPNGPVELATGGAIWMAVAQLPNRVGIGLAVGVTLACDATLAVAAGSAENVLSMSLLCAVLGLTALFMRRSSASEERAELLLAELEDAREAQLASAAIAERGRIAGELHDVLAHSLSGLAIQLEGGRKLAEHDAVSPALQDVLARCSALARQGLFDARQAVGALRGSQPPAEDQLGRLVDSFRRDLHHEASFTVTGGVRDLDPATGLALYRAAQEALTNAARYAPAAPTAVRLGYEPDGVSLTIENDGPAGEADHRRPAGGGGNGLAGMRERVERVGGVMRAGPTPTGWAVRVEIPR